MNVLRIFLFGLICVFVAQSVNAQVTVVRSDKKTVIDGKSFYLHTVKQGETRYSISKAYDVPEADIMLYNPDAVDVIKVGQELKIPVADEVATPVTRFQPKQFIYHIAEKGQTVYWLTQQYNISQEELFRHNPALEQASLQAGQVVTIPQKTGSTVQPFTPKPAYTIHTVKKKETLFSIAKNYQVDLNKVLEINPEIKPNNPKLSIGQQIKIPLTDAASIGLPTETPKPEDIVVVPDFPVSHADSVFSPHQTIVAVDSSECIETSQKEFRIAMFLPWFLADNAPASAPDTSMVKDSEGRFRNRSGMYWIHPRSANALEFYQGALLAVDSLKKQGLNAKIVVFDTMRDTIKMAQLLKSPEMKNMDLIIGPFTTELVDQVAPFAGENKIYYVSPTAINAASLKNNPYLIQVNAGEINTVGTITDYISKQEGIHVTLIGNRSEADQTLFNAYHNKLKTVFADTSLTVHRFRPDSLQEPDRYLKKNRMNVVVIPAVDEAFVNKITAKLYASANNYDINLYGLAGWTKFVNLDLEYLHTLKFSYASAFFIDYDNPQVQKFLKQFRKTYFTEPTMISGYGVISPYPWQFAFLGYDVVYYFVSAMKKYGKNFGHCIPDFRLPMLQSDFRFGKTDPYGGYMNTYFDIYRYRTDYFIVKENRE